MKCTIRYCDAEATVLYAIDRPTTVAALEDHAWTGRLDVPYCATHASERVDGVGVVRYGDTVTLRPIRPE